MNKNMSMGFQESHSETPTVSRCAKFTIFAPEKVCDAGYLSLNFLCSLYDSHIMTVLSRTDSWSTINNTVLCDYV